MRLRALILSMFVPVLIAGCSGGNDSGRIGELERRVAELDGKVAGMQDTHDTAMKDLSNDRGRIVLNTETHGYQVIEADAGIFLVAVDKVEPLGDGYRISMNIGNPMMATYGGCTMNVLWGEAFDGAAGDYNSWHDRLQRKSVPLGKDLKPGTWNEAMILVAPATAGQMEYVEFSLDTSKVYMNEE